MYLLCDNGKVTVATSKPVKTKEFTIKLDDDENTDIAWESGDKVRTMWSFPTETGVKISVTMDDETLELVTSDNREFQLGSGFKN